MLWSGTFVSESALPRLVTQLRAACGDDAQNPKFIRTLHGFGYAFCGDARDAGDEPPAGGGAAPEEGPAANPYPGLSPFAEADTDRFFGREAEVETLWGKIRRQKLLAVIGPSGVGKTSLLRAGLIPHRPSGWAAVACSPGNHPFVAVGQALAPMLATDSEAMAELFGGVNDAVHGEEPDRLASAISRWRRHHDEALLVLDQFEELFTLSMPEAQARFARLLGRLVDESGLRVVLGLRDDFFMRCGEHPSLSPAFHDVTPLLPPSAAGLERALREPAARHGVRFDDEALVEEMAKTVAAERGALPLLAFAASRLWEERDRDRRLMTREAYVRIGGMAGALAQHAEATLQQLGAGREPMVRELFRNLATAEGTRAARAHEELLSVLPEERTELGRVLDALVDARLLTEYDAPEASSSARQIEIAHESLLTHWPRLLRWRTQDAGGAQLREQFRQAAHLWEERSRPEGLVWTGASYLEYRAWRASYPGRLSSLEEDFARTMATLADRRRLRLRMGLAAIVAAMAMGLGVLATFWSGSETARRKADAEALRAEASKLLALGQTEQERYPTAALAYALKSLELSDTEEGRRFALRVLQAGPTALFGPTIPKEQAFDVAFSPNGQWLSVAGSRTIELLPWDGREPVPLDAEFPTIGWSSLSAGFGSDDDVVVGGRGGDMRTWSVPHGRELRRLKLRSAAHGQWPVVRGDELLVFTNVGARSLIERVSIRDGRTSPVGSMTQGFKVVDAAGDQIAYPVGRSVYVRSLRRWDAGPRLVGTLAADARWLAFHPDGRELAVSDSSGHVGLWSTTGSARPSRLLDSPGTGIVGYSPGGRWLGAFGALDGFVARLWDLRAPAWAEPLMLRTDHGTLATFSFGPNDRWLATVPEPALWPLGETYPRVLRKHQEWVQDVGFSVDGSTLLSASGDQTVRAWPMSPNQPQGERVLLRTDLQFPRMAVDPRGDRVAVSGSGGRVFVVSLSGRPTRELRGFGDQTMVMPVAFSPDGRRIAAASVESAAPEKVIRVWDLETGAVRVLGPFTGAGEGTEGAIQALAFVDDNRLLACSPTAGVLLLDLRDGGQKRLFSRPGWAVAVGRRHATIVAILGAPPELVRLDLEGRTTRLAAVPRLRGDDAVALFHSSVALDPTETMVATGGQDGTVRIGPVSGGEPHLFFGHTRPVASVAFSPDGLWLASGGDDNTVRLWPVPDIAKTPFQERNQEDVLATLRAWTNLRAVGDEQATTRWRIEPGRFPGWANVPEW